MRRALPKVASIMALAIAVLAVSAPAFAAAKSTIDVGDTAWVLMSTALVLLMTPGLGLFYAGMVRRKNVLGTIMQSFIMAGLVGVLWVVVGYSLAFGKDFHGVVGLLDKVGLAGVSSFAPWSKTPNAKVPEQAFMIFQAMFAVITPALITGAIAERVRFQGYLLFMTLWSLFIYCPVAHWVWHPDGWLAKYGALDFAGGTVVHICSGTAALCCAIALGSRRGYDGEPFRPHNMTMTLVGAAMLWFGWFGFNAGSALAADGIAVNAFVVTNTAAAAGAMSWLLIEWKRRGNPTALGAASGAVAGLVAITPACGYVSPMAAIAIGAVVSLLSYTAIELKSKLGYDDSLDVFAVHGVGGMWGALATGLFASAAVNSAVASPGLIYGSASLLMKQGIAVLAVMAFSAVGTITLLKVVNAIVPMRLHAHEEDAGMDVSQHGETGYHIDIWDERMPGFERTAA